MGALALDYVRMDFSAFCATVASSTMSAAGCRWVPVGRPPFPFGLVFVAFHKLVHFLFFCRAVQPQVGSVVRLLHITHIFVNNQFRIVVEGSGTGSEDLERVFRQNLVRTGQMIAILDTCLSRRVHWRIEIAAIPLHPNHEQSTQP